MFVVDLPCVGLLNLINYRVERSISVCSLCFSFTSSMSKCLGNKKKKKSAIRCVTRGLSKPSQAEFGTLYQCRQMAYACLSLYTPDTVTS